MTSYRLQGRGRVDHGKPVNFTFDGKTYQGLAGDTLASALLANGVHLMGRSFKYHRPRGVVSAGSDEPNALMGTRRGPGRFEPNTRATIQEIREGLEAASQNRWPSLAFDMGAINDNLGSLFSAGFYYKTFMWPRAFWDRVYEPVIRNAAGLGVSPTEPDADSYASRFAHVDVLVVGAGPAGLAAALAAGRSGASVMLVDENAEVGGTLLSEPTVVIDGQPAWDWLAATVAELDGLANVQVMPRTTAIGYYHQNLVGLAQRLTDHLAAPPEGAPRERMWKVRAKEVVLAQGALEKPLVFDGNDRPGVMLASAAQTYLNRYGVKVGDRPAIVTAHDSAWHAAFDLAGAGAKPVVIVDMRASVDPALTDRAHALGIEALLGRTVTGTAGRLRVTSLRVNRMEGGKAGEPRDIGCDAVLMCGGWTPCLHLFSHTQGKLAWDEALQVYLPGRKTEAVQIAGAGRGLWSIAASLGDGANAGAAAARDVGLEAEAPAFGVAADRKPDVLGRHVVLEVDEGLGLGRVAVGQERRFTMKRYVKYCYTTLYSKCASGSRPTAGIVTASIHGPVSGAGSRMRHRQAPVRRQAGAVQSASARGCPARSEVRPSVGRSSACCRPSRSRSRCMGHHGRRLPPRTSFLNWPTEYDIGVMTSMSKIESLRGEVGLCQRSTTWRSGLGSRPRPSAGFSTAMRRSADPPGTRSSARSPSWDMSPPRPPAPCGRTAPAWSA